MHFVPIAIIMRIYRFDHREVEEESMAGEKRLLN
jgi:hypothetical protein